MALQIRKAERRRIPVKLAITGPSGSGKTYSALRLAYGLCGPDARVLLIDTENGSGELYAGMFPEYDVCPLTAPFLTEKYEEAIQLGVQHQYDAVIIDSLTHAWAGSGGLLEQKDALAKRGGNSFAQWGAIGEKHESLKRVMLESPIHIIATMRSKQEYVQDEKTKKVEKLGMAPIQRDGMEYEFTVCFDVAQDHTAIASKDRTSLFNGFSARLTEEHGSQIRGWLEGATAPALAPTPTSAPINGRPTPNAQPERKSIWGANPAQPAESRGDARATAEAAVNRTQRPASTLVEGAASTPNAQCPDCHAPASKPHAKSCPQNGGADLQPTPSGRNPQGEREHQNRRLFAVYAEACEAAGVKVEDSLMRTHCGQILSQLKGYRVTVTSRSHLSTEDLAALADHISHHGIPHERQSAPSGELEMGE